MRKIRDGLSKGEIRYGCSFECSSMLLGSLIKEMTKIGLGEMQLVEPFGDRSVKDVKDVMLRLRSPIWYTDPSSSRHECNLKLIMEVIASVVWEPLVGLSLKDHRPQ